jgi:hypothetical protein
LMVWCGGGVFGSGQREGVVSGLRLLARSGRIWCAAVFALLRLLLLRQ